MTLKTPLEIFKDQSGTHIIDAEKKSLVFLGSCELDYFEMDVMAALIRRANLYECLCVERNNAIAGKQRAEESALRANLFDEFVEMLAAFDRLGTLNITPSAIERDRVKSILQRANSK